jgi:hypothetical protein
MSEITKEELDTLLDDTFDEIKKLDIQIVDHDFNVAVPNKLLSNAVDTIVDLFNKKVHPHIDRISTINYPLHQSVRNCIYELILYNDDDVSPIKKLVIMFAFYDPYFSNLKTFDGLNVKSEYRKSLKQKIITVGFTRQAAMMYKKMLGKNNVKTKPFDEAARKSIIKQWVDSESPMNTVDGGRNRKKRNSRKKHNYVKTPKRRPKSKKRKQV